MNAIEMSLGDAQQIAAYMGLRWSALEGAQLQHAEQMAYRNIVMQKHAGDRVNLRAKHVGTWERLIKNAP